MDAALEGRLNQLAQRVPRGILLGLDRVHKALDALDHPERGLRFIHVAGTNGKGSTSAMVESVARAAGLRTGLYTSPHLSRFAERIRLDGEPIDDDALERALATVLDRSSPDLTFFESVTLAAFVAFAEAKPEVVVLEVGLGGRLDATNVVDAPLATAVTSIGLDHMAMLGDTLEKIAREKAGIFKRGAPAIVHVVPSLWPLFEELAHDAGAPLAIVGRDVALLDAPKLALEGPHQIGNATVAAWLARHLREVDDASIARGLASVAWPARFERFDVDGRVVVLDCAHNPAGAAALARSIELAGFVPETTTLVYGALADKAFDPMLRVLAPRASRRVYTSPKGRAPAPLEALAAIVPGALEPDPRAALARAVAEASPGDAVVVAGSAYLAGELRARILGFEPDPVIAL